MSRARRGIASVALAAAALAAAVLLPTAAHAGAKALRVGVGRADLTSPITDVFKGGWTCSCARAIGQHTRLFARAIVLERGGRKVALVAADLSGPGIDPVAQAAADLLRGRGFSEQNLLVSASHTHGDANISGLVLPSLENPTEFVLLEVDPAQVTFLARQLAKAVRRADRDLAPGAVGWGMTRLVGLTENRSLEAHLANHGIEMARGEGRPAQDPAGAVHTIDPEVHVLRVDKFVRGRRLPVGMWSTFANHGTVVKPTFPFFTADHHGAATRLAEAALRRLGDVPQRQEVVNAYGNTDEGDMTAGLEHSGPADAERVGRLEARSMLAAWRAAGRRMSRAPALDLRWTRLCFCGQDTEEGNADSSAIVGLAASGGSEELRTIFQDVSPVIYEGLPAPVAVGPQGHKIPVFTFGREQVVPLTAVRIDDRMIVSAPGELTSGVGRRIRRAVVSTTRTAGIERAVISGLVNAYLSYFATPEEYDLQHYEGGFTLYGRTASLVLKDALVDLAGRLVAGRPAPEPDPDGGSSGLSDEGFPPPAERAEAREQPRRVERLERARFSWLGAGRGLDRPVDAPFVRVQRLARGRWRPLTDDLGLQIVWSADDEGTYIAQWEVPRSAPVGSYRFVITGQRYTLRSRRFRVTPSDELAVSARDRARRGFVVRIEYPSAVPDEDITFRPRAASGGRVRYLVDGRKRVVHLRRGRLFTLPAHRGAQVRIPAGAARDRFGNRNGERLVLP